MHYNIVKYVHNILIVYIKHVPEYNIRVFCFVSQLNLPYIAYFIIIYYCIRMYKI